MAYKVMDVARWFLEHNNAENKFDDCVEGISNMKLQKLLYYAQGGYLALYNRPLFEADFFHWQHGPVVPEVYEVYRQFGGNFIVDNEPPSVKFDDDALKVLGWVYEEFGQYTAWALRNKTHEEDPWKNTKTCEIISKESIRAYFKENYVE